MNKFGLSGVRLFLLQESRFLQHVYVDQITLLHMHVARFQIIPFLLQSLDKLTGEEWAFGITVYTIMLMFILKFAV